MTETKAPVIEQLTGSFLISTPQMPDPRFAEQVILICAHSEEGAMGVAVNKPNPYITLKEILKSANLPVPEADLPPVYIGGPVEIESAFVLYHSDYRVEHQLEISPGLSLSRESKILEDISKNQGPEEYLFLLGYAGWGPGQLESELIADGWLTLPCEKSIIFNVADHEKWRTAAMLYGIDISTLGDMAGYA
ncbi:MAG: YqgE/AlgH family protein [Desulfofustis sp.]|jgi:putative transcriptional regulator|nr:YqgE/AlgH family protein [Desulfofustis sp.]